ncbi:MAG TPA: hypothetical protein VKZ63_06350 [Kofleriaceae bacterium]|nr:hypothetical protein [Kofleriaceae bacterium]
MLAAALVLAAGAGCKKESAPAEPPSATAPTSGETGSEEAAGTAEGAVAATGEEAAAAPGEEAAAAPGEAAAAGGQAAAAPGEARHGIENKDEALARARSKGVLGEMEKAAAGSADIVAIGASGKAKVVATGKKVLADTATYTVSIAAPAAVGTGAQGTATLEIVPKTGWKLNHEFPTKLTVTPPAGVTVKKAEQTVKDAVSFGDKAGRWAIQFTASSAGDKAFSGKVKFAVCTDVSCDPKKEELAWNVKVE